MYSSDTEVFIVLSEAMRLLVEWHGFWREHSTRLSLHAYSIVCNSQQLCIHGGCGSGAACHS